MKYVMVGVVMFLRFSFTGTAYANGTPGGRWGWHHMTGGGAFMWLLWIIIIAGAIYFFVNHAHQQHAHPRDTPLDILQKRYARGEIFKEEYEEMKKHLEH